MPRLELFVPAYSAWMKRKSFNACWWIKKRKANSVGSETGKFYDKEWNTKLHKCLELMEEKEKSGANTL